MKVTRAVKMKADNIDIGDKITVKLDRKYHATAIQERENGMLFLFDDCLSARQPMNENGNSEGGYIESDLRAWLKSEMEPIFKKGKFGKYIVKNKDGDMLFLLSTKEVTGEDPKTWDDIDGQIEWMKDRRHRLAKVPKENDTASWWLRDVVSATSFADVHYGGYAYNIGASSSLGVRPAFILDLKSRAPVARKIIRCNECKFFHIDSVDTCMKWGNGHGCRTDSRGFCYLAESKDK